MEGMTIIIIIIIEYTKYINNSVNYVFLKFKQVNSVTKLNHRQIIKNHESV